MPPFPKTDTVKHHLANARTKAGATTTAQLVWILAPRLPGPQGWPRRTNSGLFDSVLGAIRVEAAAGYVPDAISASLATVFMLRAVPAAAAGIRSRESVMPAP